MIKVEEDFQTNLGGGEFFWNFEDLAATSDGIFSGFVSATNSLFMTDSFRKNSRQTFLLC